MRAGHCEVPADSRPGQGTGSPARTQDPNAEEATMLMRMIYVTLPVTGVGKSRGFFTSLGFTYDPGPSGGCWCTATGPLCLSES